MPLDLKKELKHLYNPSPKQPAIVDVPAMNFLMVDGVGDPNTAQEYRDAVQTLYGVSYALKFMLKKGEGGCSVSAGAPEAGRRTRAPNRRRPGRG